MIEADVEPDRRVERAVLVDAEPGQVVVENFRVLLRLEVAVLDAPVGDGARDAMDELAHGGLAAVLVRVGAVGDVAVEIFRDRDLRRQHAPALRHLDVLLLEDRLAGIVGDLRRALLPLDLVVGMDAGLGEGGLESQAALLELRLGRLPRHHGGRMSPAVLDPAPLLLVGVSEGTVSVRRALGRVVFIGRRGGVEGLGCDGYPAVRFLPYKVARRGVYYY